MRIQLFYPSVRRRCPHCLPRIALLATVVRVKKFARASFLFTLAALFFCAPSSVAAQSPPAPAAPAHVLFDALNALRVNPQEVYAVRGLDFRKDAIHFTFISGQLAFLQPFQGRVTGAVFTGRGHILAIPRSPTEKASMARFLGAPILDQEFRSLYLRFDDDSATELLASLHEASATSSVDLGMAEEWDPTIASLNSGHSLRILTDLLSEHPLPYFYAGVLGETSGPFEVLVDNRREEQVVLGQPKTVNEKSFYDSWASFQRAGAGEVVAPFAARDYLLETTVQPDLDLSAKATLTLSAMRGGERIIPLQLSGLLRVDSVTDEAGAPLEFFQSAPMIKLELAMRGDDSVNVVLQRAPQPGQTFRLHLSYRGRVIINSGYGVYYVGEHGAWYPHVSGTDTFATFDLRFRWPHQLQLVATGQKVDEREDGDWRESHWQSEKPMFIAGFNLGVYRVVSTESAGVKIDLYANARLDQALQPQAPPSVLLTPIPQLTPQGTVTTALAGSLPLASITPDAAAVLHNLGIEIGQATQFFSRFGGAFPYGHLEVSQVPGTFGQGWPGLLYIPTFSFISREAQKRVGLNASGQEHFTEIVPYHEVAHQWWGNLVVWHSYHDQWICEGLANYIALLFAESHKDFGHPLNTWLGRYRDTLVSNLSGKDDIVDSSGPLALGYRLNSSVNPIGYEEVTYAKATWVFHMLRMMLREPSAKDPDERFTGMLRSLAQSHKDAALSTDDLQQAVEKVMFPAMDLEGGHSMAWFFDEWIRGTGIPRYKVDYTVQKSGEQFIVKGVLHQSGVPDNFLASVPLYASYAGGKPIPLGRVVADGADTSFRFVTRVDPKHILIDPETTLLCVTN